MADLLKRQEKLQLLKRSDPEVEKSTAILALICGGVGVRKKDPKPVLIGE